MPNSAILPGVSQENVDLVRRIYSAWERGDFSETWWCADDFEFQVPDGPHPGLAHGPEGMGRYWREWLQGWRRFHTRLVEVRDVSDDVVLGVNEFGGEGRTSGLVPDSLGATVWTIRGGKVRRLAPYVHLENALSDLGLAE